MSNFLFFGDYIRFIEELKKCRELITVRDLIKGFVKFYYKDNPSLFHIFLDALWNIYPEYDLECDVDLLFEYDEINYKEYKDPKLEFIGQYIYYLGDEYFEKSLAETKTENSQAATNDFLEESKTIINNNTTKEKSSSEKSLLKSFKFPQRYKCNIIKIIEVLNEDVSLVSNEKFASQLALLLTHEDLSKLASDQRRINIYCKTNFFVYLLDELQKKFGGDIAGNLFDEMLSIHTKYGHLSKNNLYAVRSRNNNLFPIKNDLVIEVCNKYSPEKFKC